MAPFSLMATVFGLDVFMATVFGHISLAMLFGLLEWSPCRPIAFGREFFCVSTTLVPVAVLGLSLWPRYLATNWLHNYLRGAWLGHCALLHNFFLFLSASSHRVISCGGSSGFVL